MNAPRSQPDGSQFRKQRSILNGLWLPSKIVVDGLIKRATPIVNSVSSFHEEMHVLFQHFTDTNSPRGLKRVRPSADGRQARRSSGPSCLSVIRARSRGGRTANVHSSMRVTLLYPGLLTPCLSISMAFSSLFDRVSFFLASIIQRQYCLRWV